MFVIKLKRELKSLLSYVYVREKFSSVYVSTFYEYVGKLSSSFHKIFSCVLYFYMCVRFSVVYVSLYFSVVRVTVFQLCI